MADDSWLKYANELCAGDFLGSSVSISNDGNNLIAAAVSYIQPFHLSEKQWIAGEKIGGDDSGKNTSIFTSVASSGGDCKTIVMSTSSFESTVFHLNDDGKWDKSRKVVLSSDDLPVDSNFIKLIMA